MADKTLRHQPRTGVPPLPVARLQAPADTSRTPSTLPRTNLARRRRRGILVVCEFLGRSRGDHCWSGLAHDGHAWPGFYDVLLVSCYGQVVHHYRPSVHRVFYGPFRLGDDKAGRQLEEPREPLKPVGVYEVGVLRSAEGERERSSRMYRCVGTTS